MMAMPRHSMKRILSLHLTNLMPQATFSTSKPTILSWKSYSEALEQQFNPSHQSLTFFGAKNGFELLQNAPSFFHNRKFCTNVEIKGAEVKISDQNPEKPNPKLSNFDKICIILNGDVALEDLEEKLDESGIEMNPGLLEHVFRTSVNAGRKVIGFYNWAIQQPGCEADLKNFNGIIDFLGKRNDFKAVESLLKENVGRGNKGLKVDLTTFEIVVRRLVMAGREKKAVEFFDKMEEFGFKQDENTQKVVVKALCERGFASHAEKLVKERADTYFPDEEICNTLVKGWCVSGKLNEAKRMVNEMSVGKFAMDATAYNALLDCVCKLCIEKDPFLLLSEAKRILLWMEKAGVPRNEATFNILITHLCEIRKTSDAMNLFLEMESYGCSANSTTYVVLIRSLFIAARVAEGHEMLGKMKEAGFLAQERDYSSFIKVLCRIQRVEHAHKVFLTMKHNGCHPGKETYELLIRKFSRNGQTKEAKQLFDEAVKRKLMQREDNVLLEQRKVQKPAIKKKKVTLSMKRKKQNLKLKKIRLSFVKKPKRPRMMAM